MIAIFFVQGQWTSFIRRSRGETLRPEDIFKKVKHPKKVMFLGCFSYAGTGPLIPVIGIMNEQRYSEKKLMHHAIPTMTNVI